MVYDFGQVYTPRKAFNRFKGVEESFSSARGDASDSFVLDNIAIVHLGAKGLVYSRDMFSNPVFPTSIIDLMNGHFYFGIILSACPSFSGTTEFSQCCHVLV